MMLLFKEIKNILLLSSQTARNTMVFLLESLLFLILALITGFLISYPTFYLATQFTSIFQKSIFLTLILSFLFFYSYQFVQAFKTESQILSTKISNPTLLYLFSFIYASPHFIPKWIKTFSYILLGLFIFLTLVILTAHLLFFFLVNFINLNVFVIQQAYQWTLLFYQVLANIISSKPWIFSAIILELISFTLMSQAKPVLEKSFFRSHFKLSITAWYFLLTNFQICALFLSLYILATYFAITHFF